MSKECISNFITNSSLLSYLDDMERDGTWGDHLVLVSLAHALGRTIRVVSSLGDSYNVIVKPLKIHHSEPIFLGHLSENHYISLEPINASGI